MSMRSSVVVTLLLVAAAAQAGSSQTLYTIHGGVPLTSTVSELKGPPSLPFGYPGGPVVSTFPTTVPFGCATVGALPPPPVGLIGDVAFDTVGDIVWATDGLTVTSYSPAGAPLSSFPVPPPFGPLTGLGFNSALGALVVTDGAFMAAVIPPGVACGAPLVGPLIPSPAPGLLTDLEWDPVSGSFFGCDSLGFVTNIGPVGGVGPFGIFPVAGLCAPGLAGPLQGLAVDTASFGGPFLYVTDGFRINRITPAGVAAPPTFYTPASCFPVLTTTPINGLAFSLHAITFALPCHTAGGMLPMLSSTGNSTSPGAMTISIVGAPPFGLAALRTSFAIGAPVPFKGCSLIGLPVNTFMLPIGPGGAVVLPVLLPAGAAGVSIYLQAVCAGGGGFGITPGMEFTLGLP